MEEKQARVKEFAAELLQKQRTGEISRTILATSDRVLARITDGIYRQPSSALRELISNAYDADATEVVIETDAPKFETIKISDNGNGMTREALSNLIHNIGGSLKRTATENTFGVVDTEDPTLSPTLKRKLIGKIGIPPAPQNRLRRSGLVFLRGLGICNSHIPIEVFTSLC